jgi:hypothetical protein
MAVRPAHWQVALLPSGNTETYKTQHDKKPAATTNTGAKQDLLAFQLSMRLFKIKLAGFKLSSIRPPSTPSNLVGVIGPNGAASPILRCGALGDGRVIGQEPAWRLMADAIFNGSNGRKPSVPPASNRIDNSDGTVGGQYAVATEFHPPPGARDGTRITF